MIRLILIQLVKINYWLRMKHILKDKWFKPDEILLIKYGTVVCIDEEGYMKPNVFMKLKGGER